MTTETSLLKLGVIAEDAPDSMSACNYNAFDQPSALQGGLGAPRTVGSCDSYTYDAYARMMNWHTDSDGSSPAQRLVPMERLRVVGRFSIENVGHSSYSSTADTTTWYAYDYDISRWLSRDPLWEEGFRSVLTPSVSKGTAASSVQSTVLRLTDWLPRSCGDSHCGRNLIVEAFLHKGGSRLQQPIENLYLFCVNNPINYTDSIGLKECKCGEHLKFDPLKFADCMLRHDSLEACAVLCGLCAIIPGGPLKIIACVSCGICTAGMVLDCTDQATTCSK